MLSPGYGPSASAESPNEPIQNRSDSYENGWLTFAFSPRLAPLPTSAYRPPMGSKTLDSSLFWDDSPYARRAYVDLPLTEAMVVEVESELGVRLPQSYVALMKTQNGGIPRNCCFPTKTRTSWAKDHVAISGIAAIGKAKSYSLCGGLGSKFMQEEWGYPDIGVCICDCPSAGHDIVMLDYRACGPDGEPQVVHVDQEIDFAITVLAPNFEAFVRGLMPESAFENDE